MKAWPSEVHFTPGPAQPSLPLPCTLASPDRPVLGAQAHLRALRSVAPPWRRSVSRCERPSLHALPFCLPLGAHRRANTLTRRSGTWTARRQPQPRRGRRTARPTRPCGAPHGTLNCTRSACSAKIEAGARAGRAPTLCFRQRNCSLFQLFVRFLLYMFARARRRAPELHTRAHAAASHRL